jgi:hypothetical protein
MRATPALICVLLFGGVFFGCSGDGPGPCPNPITTVTLDASVDGMPDVGECVVGKTCEPFCGQGPICCRPKELVITCQIGCK